MHREVRMGPLPDAAELERYEQIMPGAAERIICMAEKEQDFAHAQSVRNTGIRRNSMLSGTIITILAIGLAAYMVHQRSEGIQYVVIALATLVGVAITGRFVLNKAKS